MYLCRNCKRFFKEPKEISTTYERYYGISDLFSYQNDLDLEVCPYCHDEDIEECDENNEEEYEDDDE